MARQQDAVASWIAQPNNSLLLAVEGGTILGVAGAEPPEPSLRARIGVDLVDSADSAVAVEDVIVLVLPGSGLAGLVAAAQDELGRRFEGLVPWNSIRAMAELHHGGRG
jgi:hypothetical protein